MFRPRMHRAKVDSDWFAEDSDDDTYGDRDEPAARDRPGPEAAVETAARDAWVVTAPSRPPADRAAPDRAAPDRAAPDRAAPDRAAPDRGSAPDPGSAAGTDAAGPPDADDRGRWIEDVDRKLTELIRLRRHDAELVDRLHAENSRLRQGELAEAMAPLLRGLMRLHDQMTSLGGDDTQSVAGVLRSQLLQVLDVAADVRPYTAVPGMPFDPTRHSGIRRVRTDDADRDRTIARTVKPGFVRGELMVVRPAEVEVFRTP
jgi:molecular chaperone GrpE (heat shock protein)